MRVAIVKMSSFSVQGFQEKLNRLTPSQDSIETLSLWVIHHKAHGKTSAAVWQDNVEKGNYEWGSRVNNPLLRNQEEGNKYAGEGLGQATACKIGWG